MRALFIGRGALACGPRPAGTARSRGAAGLRRVPVHPELGEDPDRRAPPVGGLREGAASGWAQTRRWATRNAKRAAGEGNGRAAGGGKREGKNAGPAWGFRLKEVFFLQEIQTNSI